MTVRYENLRVKLRARRKQLGLTQTAAANRMNMYPPALNQLELGTRPNPQIETLAHWAHALGGHLIIDVEFDE